MSKETAEKLRQGNIFKYLLSLLENLLDDDEINTPITLDETDRIVQKIVKNTNMPDGKTVDEATVSDAITNAVIDEHKETGLNAGHTAKYVPYAPPAIYYRNSRGTPVVLLHSYFKTKRYFNELVIHTAATRPDWQGDEDATKMFEDVLAWHTRPKPKGRGWSDAGYHFMINRLGELVIARPLSRTGAHVMGRNTNTVGVMLAGGFGGSETDHFEDHYTVKQRLTLFWLINKLADNNPDFNTLSGHNEFAAKACPCFRVDSFLNQNDKYLKYPKRFGF